MDESSIDGLRLALAAEKACEVCKGRDWRAFGQSIDGKPARLVLGATWPDATPVEDYGFAVLAQACTQCGHVRLFVADLLALSMDADDELEPESHE